MEENLPWHLDLQISLSTETVLRTFAYFGPDLPQRYSDPTYELLQK